MDEESKVVDVVNGTFDPGGGVGPIALGYSGDTPPARVLVTHDADGNHVATPYDDGEAPATPEPVDDDGPGEATATSPEPPADDAAAETDVGTTTTTTTTTTGTGSTIAPEPDAQPE